VQGKRDGQPCPPIESWPRTELKHRGVKDVFFVVWDGLRGLPDSVDAVFPLAAVRPPPAARYGQDFLRQQTTLHGHLSETSITPLSTSA
jgi:hypothetical protein